MIDSTEITPENIKGPFTEAANELLVNVDSLQAKAADINQKLKEQIRPQPRVVELVDRKDGEIKHLKLVNAIDRETIARMQLNDATRARVEASVDLEQFRTYIKRKYELDLNTQMINDIGEIVPKAIAATGMGKQLLDLLSSSVQDGFRKVRG